MSFNRANYDICSTKQSLVESQKPGMYRIDPPTRNMAECYPTNPTIRLQKTGNSLNTKNGLVDVQSELWGITRKSSKCADKKVQPCGTNEVMWGQACVSESLSHQKDCDMNTTHCRLNNPPCTLRGTGWNRWEWLCRNPQDQVFRPYEWNTNTKLVAKDNYRPCVPRPFDQTVGLPRTNPNLTMDLHPTCGNNTATPAQGWSFCPALNN